MKRLLLSLLLSVFCLIILAQTPISEVQGRQDKSPLEGQSVTITGIVTGVSSGNGYFVQDGDAAWTGVYVYDPSRNPMPISGDSVIITGTVAEYYNLTEIKTLTSFQILASGKEIPAPVEVKTGEVAEQYEGVLVKVLNAKCTNTNLGYGEWAADDGSGQVVINDFIFKFTPEEGISYSITGVVDFSYEVYKIEPRSADDLIINAPLYFTEEPSQTDITGNAITLTWITNSESSTEIIYGKTPDLDLGIMKNSELSIEHQIIIPELESGELYFIKAYSVLNSDTTISYVKSYTTKSNSSGEMKFYFGYGSFTETNENEDLYDKEFYVESFTDTIVSYIEKAKTTLDIAIYDVVNHCPCSDNQNQRIFDAITEKAKSGVKVRIITDDTSTDPFFTSIMQYANVMWGNTDGIMHHKFIVVDRESELNSWVVTGSVNWTYNNLAMDANNLICIQDKSLAKAYTFEFEELWGGSSDTPNYDKGVFGFAKKQNSPNKFIIDDKLVELYFSPSDKTEKHIVESLKTADYELSIAMMAFTSDALGQTIQTVSEKGVEVFGIIDYVEYDSTEYELMRKSGADIEGFSNPSGLSWPDAPTIHHKFAVVDYYHENSDPLVITGTHNWTASAESKNDENTLIFHDDAIARIYNNEVIRLRSLNTGSSAVISRDNCNLLYPNPFKTGLFLNSSDKISSIMVFDVNGRTLLSLDRESISNRYIDLSSFNSGIYFLKIDYRDKKMNSIIQKIIKQ